MDNFICPLKKEVCIQDKCAWYSRNSSECAILSNSESIVKEKFIND
jgi:hypothetical protein